MPCGGIYPLAVHFAGPMLDRSNPSHACLYCGRHDDAAGEPVSHFCDEWDCYLHASCIDGFLLTEEGRIVLAHGHEVIR